MNHVSLFTGSGIGTLAAQAAGIVTVAHAENDPACCYCLERIWPGVRLFRDVRDVTTESVADLGPIDICSGGFPCVDISTAGKGAGLGTEENPTRSGLWFEFARVIREIRPRYVLVENVPALLVRGGDRVLTDLEEAGYTWWAFILGAWAVGAPHKRDRVWIVGRRMEHAESAGLVSD
jgi:DNA (cytosine-5)-methyltransferase 1